MLNTIDLFVGCGGLSEGFEQSRKYKMIGAVEWEPSPVKELRNHLKNRWGINDAEERVLQFDIQRTEELFNGWEDEKFGRSKGLDALVGSQQLDVIIGGPPCQAYSVAGRIRDEHGMREDYRNYLFESYLEVVQHYKPKVFVFENVPGILSAKPGDGSVKIIDLIQKAFADAGYVVLPNLSNAIIDMTEYGVPQNRKRIIILGVSKAYYGDKAETMVEEFYSSYLPEYKVEKKATVREAIGDLPKLKPLDEPISYSGRRLSHEIPVPLINGHISRYHSKRDIDLFRFLEEDIASGRKEYTNTESLKALYTKLTGKTSNVHKYYVLRWNEPSNLIPAHLFKDGLRHIHPDPEQARTITVREAARLQTFPDDYYFNCSQTDAFKMIGNAVPPLFAKKVAYAVYHLIQEN
ncbi:MULTISPECIES: DNA cytosine methyltransferase [Lachnospiraceae]|jgi:DNA-cytosine methyltransferase|uniref:Cytosine-specific methyltransferase n=3 Tax=Lachnospiraceae TaxID=186803 RepID=A0A412T7Z9_9FIRM|nr:MULTISPECIES: DNA cytosine methyltransferase [Lachnospiraceae]RGU46135.1 DNA cytosine methyltransferase [Coprococcus comes]RHB49154.1 DNA cytosine methyltransferase [Blautia obeum]RHL48461.1 DNA cytosine methyltransferase [Blautia obeum]